jgi:hypothetical protein
LNQGGIVFTTGTGIAFLPASIAVKVMPLPTIARVPGGPPELRGIALVDGDMVAMIEAGTERASAMLVCSVLGELVGLVGVRVLATGKFAVSETGDVLYGEEIARPFDVPSLIAKVRQGRWGATLSE